MSAPERSSDRHRRRLRLSVLLFALALALAALKLTHRAWPIESFVLDLAHHFEPPDITYPTAAPGDEGIDPAALATIRQGLAAHGTTALLVVRGGRLVYEWYALRAGPDQPHYTAALAKGAIGSMALLAALTEGRLRLDEPAWKFLPQWRHDPLRSRIRIRDLAFHTSGLADVDFFRGQTGMLRGWRKTYYRHPAERFRLAIDRVPLLFTPGTHYRYSGIGYYALAYALTVALQGTADPDIRSLLRDRIMRPLGIPQRDWQISYGKSYRADGLTLYAMGSGADLTARAEARIGEMILRNGRWNGRTVVSPYWLRQMLAGTRAPPYRPDPDPRGRPVPSGGWWLNTDGAWPSLPRDAIAAEGAGHQILLVVPSLDLVFVRQGRALGAADADARRYWGLASKWIFAPLMASITGPARAPSSPDIRTARAP